MTKPFDTAAHLRAQIEHTESQIDDAKDKGLTNLVGIYANHVVDLREALAKVRMLPHNVAAIVSLILAEQEYTRNQTRSEPPPYTLHDSNTAYTVRMDQRGQINIYCDDMAKPEKWRNLSMFELAYPHGARIGFESAMCRMGILIGAMATHETDDGKRVYNNEHIQWMFEQWHRAK